MYPAYMEESIRKVEASRGRRLKEAFPRLTDEEKTALLHKYHPDYIEESMRELLVGSNKGDRTPNELADLLEGNSCINPDKIDLSKIDYDADVLVIGGGGAGASAALIAQENGADVLLATKLRLGDANTVGAQGGTQAADRPNDSPAIHYLDTMGGGHFANIPELVEALVKDAPSVIKWLEMLGVNWDKEPDGSMYETELAGESRRRCHCARDYTGLEVMRVLRDEIRNRNIDYVEFAPAIELIMDDKGQIVGAVLVNLETNELSLVRSKSVVIATGGIGRLHIQGFSSTNHYGATADGLVLAYRVGAELIFIDTMQYHPTGVAYPQQILGQLVTEKGRGLGAHLVNIGGEQFIYPLETRDVVASGIIRECRQGKGIVTLTGEVGVWLDSPMIDILRGQGTISRELPAMFRQLNRFNIDIIKEPILVYPTLHYQNGGIKINTDGATTVPGLFAAGECTGGVHGKNRLAGNSTMDIFVFGRRAGRAAAQYAKKQVKLGSLTLKHVRQWQRELEQTGIAQLRRTSPLLLPDYARHMPDYLSEYSRQALAADQVKLA